MRDDELWTVARGFMVWYRLSIRIKDVIGVCSFVYSVCCTEYRKLGKTTIRLDLTEFAL